MKIISFSQQGHQAICILSANGVVSNVTLRQSNSGGGTLTYEVCISPQVIECSISYHLLFLMYQRTINISSLPYFPVSNLIIKWPTLLYQEECLITEYCLWACSCIQLTEQSLFCPSREVVKLMVFMI